MVLVTPNDFSCDAYTLLVAPGRETGTAVLGFRRTSGPWPCRAPPRPVRKDTPARSPAQIKARQPNGEDQLYERPKAETLD